MLIMIYGDDGFRVNQKVKQMRDSFREKFDVSGMNTQMFPPEGTSKYDVGSILQAVCSYPFLGSKRMVIIRDLIGATKKADQSVWVEGFSRMPESTIVVLWETETTKAIEKKPLFLELSKMSEVHGYPFPLLEGAQLNRWVQDRVKEKNATIEPSALRGLIERVGSDLWQMNNEIDKLVAYSQNQPISLVMIDELVHASFEGKIFELMDAISKKQPSRALQLLQEERWSGANDHYLLTMLGRQVRVLLSARQLLDESPSANKQALADALGIHPFVAQKALEQARGFRFEDLKKAHDFLFDFDFKLKSGRIKADLAVDLVTDQLVS